jgi:hypothetical protein
MCVQEGNLLYMWETDLGYFWVPNGKQVKSRLEVSNIPQIPSRSGQSHLYTTSSVCSSFPCSDFDAIVCLRARPQANKWSDANERRRAVLESIRLCEFTQWKTTNYDILLDATI